MKQNKSKEARIVPLSGTTMMVSQKKTKEVFESLRLIDEMLNEESYHTLDVLEKSNTKQNNILLKMKRFLIRFTLIIVFAFPSFLYAQQKEKTKAELKLEEVYSSMGKGEMNLAFLQIDSVIAIAEVEDDLFHLGLGWNAKAEFLFMIDKDKEAIPFFKKALYYFKEINDTDDILRQYSAIGQCFSRIGQLDSAMYYLSQADAFEDNSAFNDSYNLGLNNIYKARVYSQLGQIDKAIECLHLVLELDSVLTPNKLVAHNSLGSAYIQYHNFEKAEEHIDLAFDHYKNKKGIILGSNRLNKSRIAIYQGKLDEAEQLVLESIDNYQISSNKELLPYAKTVYASIKFDKNEIEKAQTILNEIIESDFNSKSFRSNFFFITKAKIALKRNALKEIPELLEKAETNSKMLNDLFNLRSVFEIKTLYYEKVNDPINEVKAMKEFKTINDSLFNIQRLNIAQNVEAKYKTKQKEQMIAQLEFEDKVKASRLATQKNIIIGSIIGLCLLAALLFQLFRRNKQVKRQNEVIAKALSDKDILLREIHHRVKNNLQLVSSLLGLQGMTTENQHIKEAINAGKSRVMSMALIHQDLYNKEKLTSVNVKEYLDKLCGELISTYQLSADQVQLETEIEELDLDVETLIPLGLIINELLTNALKYAFPHNQQGIIHIKLFEKNNLLHLEVNDNGIGMSNKVASNSSFGFRMIKSLLRQLDGEMQTDGTDGTQFQFQFKDFKKVA